jgi:predicted small lipoprotein YifL
MKTTFVRKLVFALLVIVATGLNGCGKKPPAAKNTVSEFEHPTPKLLQQIASKQGWKIEDVEAENRAEDALESNQQPADADWQLLVKAADTEPNNFDLSLMMEFSRHMTDKYRAPVLKWCERNMTQTNDPYAAVIGYDCYIRSDGSDKDLWAERLKARGQFYIEKIAEADKRAEARKKLVP